MAGKSKPKTLKEQQELNATQRMNAADPKRKARIVSKWKLEEMEEAGTTTKKYAKGAKGYGKYQ